MMAKKKRVVEEDDSNAVNVFQSVDGEQDLLAAAMAEEPSSKKKKSKGGAAAEEVPVFVEVSEGEDLLAAALAEEPSKKKKDKKKKGKGGAAAEEVPVFAEVAEGEDLLAAALAEDDGPSSKKKKNKKKDKGQDDAAAEVPVFMEVEEGEDLLAAELTNGTDKLSKKKNKKKNKGSSDPVELEATASEADGFVTDLTASPDEIEVAQNEEADSAAENGTSPIEAADSEEEADIEAVEDDGEDFEIDEELSTDLENLAQDVEDFTMRGVKKRAQAVRKGAVERTGGDKFAFVRLEEVGINFKNADVLKSVTWEVKTGDRIGLVGQNGCGKTTQLKIIAGQLEPSSGEVIKSSQRLRCSFLRQEFVDELDVEETLRKEFQKAFAEESKALKRYSAIESELADSSGDMEQMESLLNEMEDLRQRLDASDGWNMDSRIDRILPLLGFENDDLDSKVGSFSGGWKVRIGLGKILLENPDILLLDEPTNHLDLDSVEWLENFLRTTDLPMVIVSHDREFMDRLCTKIVETESGEAFEYKGNYTDFIKQKKMRREQWEAAWDKQKKFIDEQRHYIRRFRSSAARSAQVKSREKMLARLEKSGDWVRQPPRGGKPLVFRFPPAPRSGQDVCIVDELSHGYDGELLFKEGSFVLERGDRIAVVGPNGAGKSTLLRLVLGMEKPLKGTAQCKDLHGVIPAYYAQNQADELDLNKTVLETVNEAHSGDLQYEEVRAVLGKFLFKGDAVHKPISALSGGEKARVALCKFMVSPANFLILDEPTNHLDIPAKEMLEEALQAFDGTILVVSHDRYFVSRIARAILAIEDGEVAIHDGDYRSYIERNQKILDRLKEREIDGVTNIRNAPALEEVAPEPTKEKKRKKSFGGSGLGSGKTKEMNAKRWSR